MGHFNFFKKQTNKPNETYEPTGNYRGGKTEEKKPLPPKLKFHYFTTDKEADYRFWENEEERKTFLMNSRVGA